MAHDLTELNGRHLVAVNVERGHPWHQLGQQVHEDMNIEQALELVGVEDEKIQSKPLWVVKDNATTKEWIKDEPWVRVSDLEAVDKDVSVAVHSSVFGTMSTASQTYHSIQRRHLLELAYDITGLTEEEHKGYVDTIGNLGKHGDTFFAYVRVPDIVIDPGGVHDVIEHGLFVATSYNQSLPNTIGYSPIRPVCRNTVTMGLGQLSQTIRVRHTKHSEERIKEAAIALEYAGAVEAEIVKRAERMLKVDGEYALNEMFRHFYDISEEGLSSKAKTTRIRQRGAIMRLYAGEGNTTTSLVGYNGWAAWQAFVEHKDHESDVKGDGATLTRARNAVLPGKVINDKIKASELVLSLN